MLSRWKALRDRSVQAVHDRVEGEASVDAALAALDMEADLLREELAHVGRMRAILVAKAGRAAPDGTGDTRVDLHTRVDPVRRHVVTPDGNGR